MSWYRRATNIKIGLFFLGIVLIAGLLVYSQWIVARLRHDNREIVKLYAELIAKTVNEKSDTNLNFVFDEIIKKVQFPIIYSDLNNQPLYWRNIPSERTTKDLIQELRAMDRQNNPFPLEYIDHTSGTTIPLGYLHYGDSVLIRRLQWLPFLEIGAVALFILLGFSGFTFIRNSEKHHIWVGMARETAHQLGTPVSALMGWIERIKSHPEDSVKIITEMEADLDRLNQVSERFSKMGSKTTFKEVKLVPLVRDVTQYLSQRLPVLGKKVNWEIEGDESIVVHVNPTLFSWALENVIRNGIDAIQDEQQGTIKLSANKKGNQVFLTVEDNGKGIPLKNWKNIFRPGFSSKDRGWGLGLSLVKRIIEEIHGGSIRVFNSKIGAGTVFEIHFP
ncbi:MAG: PAS domain-containing sensor histidine kinase [Fidelibacterota bacterium]